MFTMSDILKWHKRLTPFSDALNINNHLCVLRFLGLSRSPKSLLWLLSVSEELFIKLLLTLLSSSSLLISLINGLVQAFLVCTPEHSPLSLGPEIVRPDPLPLLSPPFFGAPLPCPPLIPLFPPLAPLPPLLDLTDANPGFGVLVVIFRAFFFGRALPENPGHNSQFSSSSSHETLCYGFCIVVVVWSPYFVLWGHCNILEPGLHYIGAP